MPDDSRKADPHSLSRAAEAGTAAPVVPSLREALTPFADAVPWPVVVVDEPGKVLYLNVAMRALGRALPDKGPRQLGYLFPEYFAALRGGAAPWLEPQDAEVVRPIGPGVEIRERVWVRRLPAGACLIIIDETRLQSLETAHAQTARLASLGFMLASASHEIGNPLSAMHTMLQVLQSKRDAPREVLEQGIHSVSAQVRRIVAITRKLNAFARVSAEPGCAFGIDSAIAEAAVMLGYDSLGETVQLVHERCPVAWTFGHADQLQQVFHNLFLNAAQAMQGKGSIWVGSRLLERSVEVTVRDSGPGLAEDVRSRVFEPFFTTKPRGEGTGLGLAISYEIVHEHQGTLRAGNHPEGGALFTLTFPRHDRPA